MAAYLFPVLTADQIEVKVKQVTAKGALLLLYKTARTDYDILDEVLGADGWKVEYSEIKGNLYCTLSIWSDARGGWVSKTNCGTESREDGDGNEKKGEASDAFKRAGVTCGIGRELYTSPFIFANVATKQNGSKYELADRYATFDVKEIGYDDARRINRLVIVDNNGKAVFTFPRGNVTPLPKQEPKSEPKQEPAPDQGARDKPCDPKQIKILCGLCTTDELNALKKIYGDSFERLSLEGAVKVIAKAQESKAKREGGN